VKSITNFVIMGGTGGGEWLAIKYCYIIIKNIDRGHAPAETAKSVPVDCRNKWTFSRNLI
jgi:hypothetical protein